jgi:DNA-binding response OmpR family regulator
MLATYDIVLVEDDVDLGNVVSEYLKLKNFNLRWFTTAAETLNFFATHTKAVKLFIIDVGLPDSNGFELAQQIGKQNPGQVFLFLTARNEKQDRLQGLGLGAIDYIGKPFEIEELVLRANNIISRISEHPTKPVAIPESSILIGDITYLKNQLCVILPGNVQKMLTLRESELLEYLYRQANSVVRKNEILLQLWGADDYFNGKSLEVFISRLRRMFKVSRRVSIENVYKVGYMLKVS